MRTRRNIDGNLKGGKDAIYVHELDELKANVNRMGAELAGMNYMRKDFVSNVSHEIKTPVAAMMGFAEIMLEDNSLSEEQREHLTLIYDEAGRVSRLCENMLHMSRLENQALVTRHERVAVDEQIRKCVILLSEKRAALKSKLFTALRDGDPLADDHAGGCVLYEKRE